MNNQKLYLKQNVAIEPLFNQCERECSQLS
ncbi:hypothetical protein NIES4073_31210 [Kalymmatonema gypsitolerans NIES-4073]|nr:hypothetical protein NIES4073_31210 [Scytonema sp. NIES-4073]